MTTRRNLLLTALAAPSIARAQGTAPFPNRPIRIVLPYGPGGQSDTVARLIAPRMGAALGQSVVVENRTGAGGSIGAGIVAGAPADGHTLLFDAPSFLIVPFAVRNLPFDYERDFTPLGMAVSQPYVLGVTASFPAQDVAGLVVHGRTGKPIGFGTPGVGSIGHLAGAMLGSRAGISMEHVAYRGGADAARDLAAGNLEAAIITPNSLDAIVQSGRARALGQTSERPSPLLPGIPTIAAAGFPGFDLTSWNAAFARSSTPEPILEALERAFRAAVEDREVQDAFRRMGGEPGTESRAAFGERLARERAVVRNIIESTGITF
ncbi:Bug family tripartite tricarboxylate transporter substrate binding protein [Roseomonas harenae]|uniref:Bug family tripartite tricarboxylate transporter substrate binding protein n=1 Tax=Muricoccus harenae TaxID=2692566 RepID=UPI001331452E|nr:tripartite tricarboxylate transporter substrate-binding protein [Roseomonas harenae]